MRAANARKTELAKSAATLESTRAELYAHYSDRIAGGIGDVLHRPESVLADCLRADAKRFSAYKAHYVRRTLDEILGDTREADAGKRTAEAERAIETFERWGETERGYAMASAQMAEKWEDIERGSERYWLQYRTAADEKVRAEHAVLHGITLPASDPFWEKYYPPNGWNCRCTVVTVRTEKYPRSDSLRAMEAGEAATEGQRSFRFNPGKTKTCFPETVSYYKHANSSQRRKLEKYFGDNVLRKESKESLRKFREEKIELPIDGEAVAVVIDAKSLNHISNDIGSHCDFLGNEIVKRLPDVLRESRYAGQEANMKTDKKPSAVRYLYYEYKIGNRTFFFNVEENFVVKENRRFFRLYALTDAKEHFGTKEESAN